MHSTGSQTITGTMWLSLGMVGMSAASSACRTFATRSWWRARSAPLVFRWRIEAAAPAATAGGSEVVKMKPEAKLRTKSHSFSDAVM